MATSIREGLITFVQERVSTYDDSIDTAANSRFYLQVIQPLVDRLGEDPTEVSAEQVILDRLRAYDPTINTERGTGIRDLLVAPLSTILEPFRMAVLDVRRQASWEEVDTLTAEEADRLAEDIFVSRDQGDRASGSLRLLFGSPREVFVTPANVAYAGDLRFIPSRTQTISHFAISSQISGAYYYFDIDLQAENPGEEYEVEPGSITTIEGVTGLIGVQQIRRFSGGRDRQSNEELREYAREAITTRTMASVRAIRTTLQTNYPTVGNITVVGRGDALMERDIIIGQLQVAGIPYGVRGPTLPSLGLTPDGIHIGGMTDVWIDPSASSEDVQDSVDVLNIEDQGAMVTWSATGSVLGSLTPDYLDDDSAFFLETDGGRLPVKEGDVVVVEGVLDGGTHKEFTIDVVEAKRVHVTEDITVEDLPLVSYEIRRKKAGVISLNPATGVAEASDGSSLLSTEGDPLLPVPGKLLSSEGVASDQNRTTANMDLPVGVIQQVELLDPITLQPSGELIPEADPVVFYLYDRVSPTTFWVRVVYRLPTQFAAFANPSGNFGSLNSSRFYSLDETRVFDPLYLMTGPNQALPIDDSDADSVTPTIRLNDVSSNDVYSTLVARSPQAGDLITYMPAGGSAAVSSVIKVASVGGDPNVFTVADDIFPLSPATGQAIVTQGTTAIDMTTQEDNGLYAFDFLAVLSVGSSEVLGEALALPTSSFYSHGWRLTSRLEGLTFSMDEDLTFEVTETVNDDTDLTLAGTGVRITYLTTPLIETIQRFFDRDEERLTADDVLVRRMPYAFVHLFIQYAPGAVSASPNSSAAIEALAQAIVDEGVISATDLSNIIEELGADEVTYPFFCIVEFGGKSRVGKDGHGRLHSFRTGNGSVLPEGVADIIRYSHSIAAHRPGNIDVFLKSLP